ncbi:MAG: hypothetical protein NVSMB26_11650 [Beijerinckiaceae bacterium]
MSLGGSSERVGFLRAALARIDARAGAPAHAMRPFKPAARVSLGAPEGGRLSLDRVLGGGLPTGTLHEVIAAHPRDGAAASAFASALAVRLGRVRPSASLVWIVEDVGAREAGLPYAPGLRLMGLDPARLILVRTLSARETLWAMEEALKCRGVSAVIAETWAGAKDYSLTISRRLVLAARSGGTAGLLRHVGATGSADAMASAAATRFEVAARRSAELPAAGRGPPLPGPASWGVRVVRTRAGSDGIGFGLDWEKFWEIVWDHEETCFRDALSLPLVAASSNRPAHPASAASALLAPLRSATPSAFGGILSGAFSNLDEGQRRAASRRY